MDASDGGFFFLIFVLVSTSASAERWKNSLKSGILIISRHIFLDEQFGGIVVGKTCVSLA